jgi:hypothetical protein
MVDKVVIGELSTSFQRMRVALFINANSQVPFSPADPDDKLYFGTSSSKDGCPKLIRLCCGHCSHTALFPAKRRCVTAVTHARRVDKP